MMSLDLVARMGPEVAAAAPVYQYKHLVSFYLTGRLAPPRPGSWSYQVAARNSTVLLYLLEQTMGRGRRSVALSYRELSRALKMGPKPVKDAVLQLEDAGVLMVGKRAYTEHLRINEYTVDLDAIERVAREEML